MAFAAFVYLNFLSRFTLKIKDICLRRDRKGHIFAIK
jgi:hypothetical protein